MIFDFELISNFFTSCIQFSLARAVVKSYPLCLYAASAIPVIMDRKAIRIGKAVCLAAMATIPVYAFARLYLLSQRADISILLLNIISFAGIAGVFIYLSKKERDLEEEELFRD